MSLKNRILSLVLSAAMLLLPMAGIAEELGFSAGDLTLVTLEESYAAGEQINVSLHPSVQIDEGRKLGKRATALANLIGKIDVEISAYDDFGTGCYNVTAMLDGVKVLSADVLKGEDGSIQAMSSLTGKYVFTLPAGSVDVEAIIVSLVNNDELSEIEVGSEEYWALSASDRLRVCTGGVAVMLLSQLLGWTSFTQIDNDGQLYVFDDTPIEATETRDAVAQRMVGTIYASDFCALLWNIMATLTDDYGDFQQAIADVLAEQGVTRYQVRQVIDSLLTEEQMNPAEDYVELSHNIPDDGALCQLGDIAYGFKKLLKCVDNVWENSNENLLHMIVSYDEMGGMVSLLLDLPIFSEVLPYEGSMTYDIRTDENGQRFHTSHGELQVLDGNRIIGDLQIKFGQDVEGTKESYLQGNIGIANGDERTDLIVGSQLVFSLLEGGDAERVNAGFGLGLNLSGTEVSLMETAFGGVTTLTDDGFVFDGNAVIDVDGVARGEVKIDVNSSEYEEKNFSGGQAVDVTNITDEAMEAISGEVVGNAAKLGASFLFHPGVLGDVMTLLSNPQE